MKLAGSASFLSINNDGHSMISLSSMLKRWTLLLLLVTFLFDINRLQARPMTNELVPQQIQLLPSIFPVSSPALPADKRITRLSYNFGLGKRQQPTAESNELPNFYVPFPSSATRSDINYVVFPITTDALYGLENVDSIPAISAFQPMEFVESKRNRPQRFSFGLGKRSKELQIIGEDEKTMTMDNENNINNKVSDKETVDMEKRFNQSNDYRKIKKLKNFEDFMKRRYSFGLGKRSA